MTQINQLKKAIEEYNEVQPNENFKLGLEDNYIKAVLEENDEDVIAALTYTIKRATAEWKNN